MRTACYTRSMLAAAPSAAVLGIDALDVLVEVHVANGLPQWTIVGMKPRCSTKRQVSAKSPDERPLLEALPLRPFRYYRYGTQGVHVDGCVEVEAAYYGVPPEWISQQVAVQWNDRHVRVLDPRSRPFLRKHLRTQRGHHRVANPDHLTRTPTKTLALPDATRKAGPSIGAVCDHIHRTEGALAPSRILGSCRARARVDRRLRKTPRTSRSRPACRHIAFCAAISSA